MLENSQVPSPAVREGGACGRIRSLGPGANPDIVAAWVVIAAEAVRQPEVREAFKRAAVAELDLLTGMFGACLRQLKRDDAGARDLAAGLLALIEGAYQLASAAGEVMPSGYAAKAALCYALAALASD